MNPSNQSELDAALAARLQDEAAASAPEFSNDLHRRIMQRIETSAADRPAVAGRIGPGSHGLTWRLAAAAAIILGVGTGSFFVSRHLAEPEVPLTPARTISLGNLARGEVFSDMGSQLQQQLNEGRYGYVDQDAKKLVSFVADRVRKIPPEQQGR